MPEDKKPREDKFTWSAGQVKFISPKQNKKDKEKETKKE